MREKFPEVVERGRLQRRDHWHSDRGDTFGAFVLKAPTGRYLRVIACDGRETRFDHVSATVMDSEGRGASLPGWEEMCWLKGLFFGPDELVIQFHPPESEYVNVHRQVLHLWRVLDFEIPLPPRECV